MMANSARRGRRESWKERKVAVTWGTCGSRKRNAEMARKRSKKAAAMVRRVRRENFARVVIGYGRL